MSNFIKNRYNEMIVNLDQVIAINTSVNIEKNIYRINFFTSEPNHDIDWDFKEKFYLDEALSSIVINQTN